MWSMYSKIQSDIKECVFVRKYTESRYYRMYISILHRPKLSEIHDHCDDFINNIYIYI